MKKAVSLLLSVSFIFSALGFSQVFSEESGREVYLFKEDFSEYNVEKNTNFRDYPSEGKSDVNLGFGFAGKWSPERDEISDFLEVYPKINTLYNGSIYGRLGDTAYRNLAEPIVFDKDIELDLKFKMRCASPADFCGMEFGRNGVKVGIEGGGNAFIAACGKEIWGSSVTEYSALNSYEVHIAARQNGEDIITLSVYDEAGEKAGQAELACELENTVIDNIGVIFNSTPMYVTDISASYEARLEDMLNAQTEIDISQYYNCRIYGTTDTSVLHNPNVVTGPNEGFEVNAFKNLEGWQKEWDGDYNTYVLDGTKYTLKVKEGLTDCAYRTMADDRAVDVFDVKNAGYKELCLLVNTDNTFYSSGIAYLGVILEYTDGTREFVKNRIYNGSEDRGSEQNQIAGLKISANERIVGGELYIHELKIPIDSKKTLDKIEFLNSYAVLNDDESDVVGFEVTDETKQTYRATIYAATLKQTLSSFKEETEKETAACLKSLSSQGVSGEDVLYYIDTVEKIDELINKSEGLEIAFSEFENYNTYAALKELEESVDVSDISIYVSPEGDDINSGREAAPLKTARKALEKVKRIRKRYKDIAVSVYFGGGEYYIDDTIVLDEGISGDEKNPVTFSAIKGEEPVFTGAVSLEAKDFFKVTDEDILKRLPKTSKNKVLAFDLAGHGITEDMIYSQTTGMYGGYGLKYNSLYADGEEQTLARWPNVGYAKIKGITDTEEPVVRVDEDKAQRWQQAPGIILESFFATEYSSDKHKVLNVNPESAELTLGKICTLNKSATGRYYAYNLIEELDVPGEYYIENSVLYYYPSNNFLKEKLSLSVSSEDFITVNNASNINIEGITFEKSCGNIISIKNSEDISVNSCRFKDVGKYSIDALESRNIHVTDCDFYNLGSTGVSLSGGNYETLEESGNEIANCTFNKFSQFKRCYSPAVSVSGVGAVVRNNVMHNSPHEAVAFDGNEHKILYNEIYDVCLDTSDCGAIYSGRNLYKRGVEIAYNYIHNVKSEYFPQSTTQKGVYFDDRLSGGYIHHNVFEGCGEGVFVHGGQDMEIKSNIAVNCIVGIALSNCGTSGALLYEEAKNIADTYPVYYEKYPGMENLYARDDEQPRGNVIEGNLLVNSGDVLSSGVELGENLATQSRINGNKTTDEGDFADENNHNYELKADSNILKELPELAKIKTELFGLKEREADNEIDEFEIRTVRFCGDTAYISWEPAGSADYYRIDIAKDKDFKSIVDTKKVYANAYEYRPQENEMYYCRVTALKDSENAAMSKQNKNGARPVFLAEQSDVEIVLAAENWEYDFSQIASERLYDYPSEGENNVNGGFGFSGRWSSAPGQDGLSGNTEYVRFHSGLPGDLPAGASLKIKEKGFWSNGPAIYRGLSNPADFSGENEIYIRFTAVAQKVIAEAGGFAGISAANDKIVFGASRYSDTENRAAIKTPDGNVVFADKVIKTGNNIYSYVAKIEKDSAGNGKLYLKAYDFGIGEELYPEEWDVTAKCSLADIANIENISYKSDSANTYHGSVKLYKNMESVKEEEASELLELYLCELPEDISVDNAGEYKDIVLTIENIMSLGFNINYDLLPGYDKYNAYKQAEANMKPISETADISELYNTNAFNKIGSGVNTNARIYQDVPNLGFDIDAFKALGGWKNPWGTRDTNILEIDGVYYRVKAAVEENGKGGQVFSTSYDTQNLTTPVEIENGYYSKINILGSTSNGYYTQYSEFYGVPRLGIVLVYEDGTKEIKEQILYRSDVDRSGEQGQISAPLCTKDEYSQTVLQGYAHVYEFKADPNKKLDRIEILNSYTELTEDRTEIAGHTDAYYYTAQNCFEYGFVDGYKNINGDNVSWQNAKTYGHLYYGDIYAITAVSTLIDTENTLMDIISSWEKNPTGAYTVEKFEEYSFVEEKIKLLNENGYNTGNITCDERYMAMKEAASRLLTEYVMFDISDKFNAAVYADRNSSESQNPNAITGPNYGYEINAFKALDGWKYDWDKVKDYFNIINFAGVDYKLKVREGLNANQTGRYCAWRTTDNTAESVYLDIQDGHYSNISMLVNTDTKWYGTANNTGYAGIIYVYSDGGEELEYKNIFSAAEKGVGVEAIACDKISAQNVVDGEIYLHKIDFKPNVFKTLTGIKFVQSNAYLSEDKKSIAGFYMGDSGVQDFRATIYAVTGEKISPENADIFEDAEAAINALPEEISESDCQAVDAIADIIEELQKAGYSEENIVNIQKYYNALKVLSFEKGVEIQQIQTGTDGIKAEVFNKYFKEGIKAKVYLALYDDENRLHSVSEKDADISFRQSGELEFIMEIPEDAQNGWHFEMFFWDSNGFMIPLAEKQILSN